MALGLTWTSKTHWPFLVLFLVSEATKSTCVGTAHLDYLKHHQTAHEQLGLSQPLEDRGSS